MLKNVACSDFLRTDRRANLTDRATAYGIEVSTEKSKIVINSMTNVSADISKNGPKLEEVSSLKYLRATLCKHGTYSEVCNRIATAMARLNRIWWCNAFSFSSKLNLYKSFCHLHPPVWL